MNTIDSIGEAQASALFIKRSLTEFIDDELAVVGDSAFAGMINLTTVDLPSVKTIEKNAFYGCKKLSSVSIPSAEKIGTSAFAGNNKNYAPLITSISLPSAVTIMSDAFLNDSKLETVYLPAADIVYSNAFSGTAIEHLDIPLVTRFVGNPFGNNFPKIVSVNVPNLVTIDNSSFAGLYSMKSLDLPKVTVFPGYVFSGSNIVKLKLGSATSFAKFCFANVTKLKTLIIETPNMIPKLENNSYLATDSKDVVVYVPDALVEDYKSATNWSTYADRIKPISELPAEEEET